MSITPEEILYSLFGLFLIVLVICIVAATVNSAEKNNNLVRYHLTPSEGNVNVRTLHANYLKLHPRIVCDLDEGKDVQLCLDGYNRHTASLFRDMFSEFHKESPRINYLARLNLNITHRLLKSNEQLAIEILHDLLETPNGY